MRTILFKTMTLGALMIATTTGCLPQKEEPAALPSSRDALVKAMKTQANGIVESFNKVIADSNFIKNLELENPPKPISLENEEEVNKAIEYLLANEVINEEATLYYPDKRICSEIIAKDNPTVCEKVAEKISIAQVAQDEKSGYVQIHFAGTNPFNFVYNEELISMSIDLSSLLAAAKQLDIIKVANGEVTIADKLPAIASGNVSLTTAQKMGASILDLTINQAISIQGVNPEGRAYAFSVPAAQNLVTISMFAGLDMGTVSLNAPAFTAQVPVHDHNETLHDLAISFPGMTGLATLNNAMSMVDLSAVKLSGATVQASIDGQAAAQLTVNGQVDAQLTTIAGGHKSVNISSEIEAQLNVSANNLFEEVGSVTAHITPNTELYFAKDSHQAEVVSGSFTLVGTQDFTANMNAQPGMCIEGEDQPFFLKTVACQ